MYEEIHGVDQEFMETPELLASSLAELEEELKKLSHKPAYDLAYGRKKEFVTDPKFRLMFLRCDRWNAKKAAHRLTGFLEYKLDLFGPERLVKRITLEDLSEDDLEPLNCGARQLLPTRDKAGRAVVVECQNYWKFKETDNVVRNQVHGSLVLDAKWIVFFSNATSVGPNSLLFLGIFVTRR